MAAGETLISVRNVGLSYRVRNGMFKWSRFTPLEDVSFELRRGETLGLIGRNGAGKSTLLRIVAGIMAPDTGHVLNRGARVSLLSLGVGFVPHLSGRENAMLSGLLLGIRHRDMRRRMDRIIEFSGLEGFIEQPFHTYSAGMRARLGFSTAIQVEPDVLLIDEVLGVGDQEFRIKSNAEIKRLVRSERAVMLVSHNIQAIKELCGQTAWIECGRVRALAETGKVLQEYVSN
jgi:lipopolysaccharide transport system ATP-binding protein